jgi:dTDP-4-dehydrorhamnose reductase
VLILGATGMLGHACVSVLGPRFEVTGTVRDPDSAAGAALDVPVARFDAWTDRVEEVIAAAAPEVVINCIGLVKQLPEASRPRAAIRLNALFPHEAAEACEAFGARLIHVSTDCVFSGRLPLGSAYAEDATPDPEDLYGRSKLLGEVSEPALTIRTSLIGPELERRSGLLEWFRAQAGATITGFRRAIFSGLTTVAFAELLAGVIAGCPELAGTYHVASEPISKYDLLVALRAALELECEIVGAEEPVINRALDGRRFAAATGLGVPTWGQMISGYREPARDAEAA